MTYKLNTPLNQNSFDIAAPRTLFRNPALQAVINKTWFDDAHSMGVTHRKLFATEDGALRNEVVALTATVVSVYGTSNIF